MQDVTPSLPEEVDVERLLAEAEQMSRDLARAAAEAGDDLDAVPFEAFVDETARGLARRDAARTAPARPLADLLHDPDEADDRVIAGAPSTAHTGEKIAHDHAQRYGMPDVERSGEPQGHVPSAVDEAQHEPAQSQMQPAVDYSKPAIYVDDGAEDEEWPAGAGEASDGFREESAGARLSTSRGSAGEEAEAADGSGEEAGDAAPVLADVPSGPAPKAHGSPVSTWRSMRNGIRNVLRLVRRAPMAAMWPLVMLIVVLNRPFEGMSDRARRAAVIVGLATLIAGLASWILPPFLNQNPFLAIEARTAL